MAPQRTHASAGLKAGTSELYIAVCVSRVRRNMRVKRDFEFVHNSPSHLIIPGSLLYCCPAPLSPLLLSSSGSVCPLFSLSCLQCLADWSLCPFLTCKLIFWVSTAKHHRLPGIYSVHWKRERAGLVVGVF